MISRRQVLQGGAVAGFGLMARGVRAAPDGFAGLAAKFAAIEAGCGGRLGVAVLDTESHARVGYRVDERFPMCSTFKLLAAGAILTRVDAGRDRLTRRIHYLESDLVAYSPESKKHVGGSGMSLAELCEAALTLSDNTAANLLLRTLGGPSAVTAFARTLGDRVTRLDRNEPTLNSSIPGDPRDVTTPGAMLGNLRHLTLGDALTPVSRGQLVRWLAANKTGDARLRAGLPSGWRVGDKTGTGDHGSTNDVAVIWPEGRAPLLITTYLTQTEAPAKQRDETLAAVSRVVVAALGATG